MTLKLVIMASGRGSNAKAIMDAIKNQQLDAEILAIISNKPDAKVLDIAQQYGVKTLVIPSFGLSREVHEKQLIEAIKLLQPDNIILAGYMRLFTGYFVNAFAKNTIINIHPSLLPDFKGAHAYENAWEANVTKSGITVHYVTEAMDDGPIIAQECFNRLPDDTFNTFQKRGLAVEHKLYPQVLQQLAKAQETQSCLPV